MGFGLGLNETTGLTFAGLSGSVFHRKKIVMRSIIGLGRRGWRRNKYLNMTAGVELGMMSI